MDDTKLIPITRDNLEQLKAIAEEFGMPRSIRWYERLLFSNFQKDEPVKCRGYLVQSDAEGVVGCLCLAPIEGWFKQTPKTFYRITNFACRKKYGVHALELIAEIMEQAKGGLMFTNSLANQTSLKCYRFARFREGPEAGQREYYANIGLMGTVLGSRNFLDQPRRSLAIASVLCPVDYISRKALSLFSRNGCRVIKDFSHPGFVKFWQEVLQHNDGIMTSRAPNILCDLFNESLKAGTMVLLAKFSGGRGVVGYVLLRKSAHSYAGYCEYRIADWCAIDNETRVLSELLQSASSYCATHCAWRMTYTGGNSRAVSIASELLQNSKVMGRQTFVYHVEDSNMGDSLVKNDGWFFGPYDGDRSLGYGGYVDM